MRWFGADSDASPYDSGSYASSTTYVTGKAVERACEQLKENLCAIAAQMMDCKPEDVEFTGKGVRRLDGGGEVSLMDIATKSMCGNAIPVQVTYTHTSPVSPPPFMVGMAEIEVDKETGGVEVLNYVAVVDCGTPINPNLARVQTEGGIVQGIGMALFEGITYDEKGNLLENSFMQYKIPTRLDMGHLRWSLSPATSPLAPSEPSPSARSLSIPRLLPSPTPSIVPPAYAPGTAHHPGEGAHGHEGQG